MGPKTFKKKKNLFHSDEVGFRIFLCEILNLIVKCGHFLVTVKVAPHIHLKINELNNKNLNRQLYSHTNIALR